MVNGGLLSCGYCGREISGEKVCAGEQRVFSVGVRGTLEFSKMRGPLAFRKLALTGRTIMFFVCGPNSLPKEEANLDFICLTCSQECTDLLRQALLLDRWLIEIESEIR